MIAALLEHPLTVFGVLVAEPLAVAVVAYGLVWSLMRPKTGQPALRMFWWHFWGIVTTLLCGATFRLIAIITFAGKSAWDTSDQAAVIYKLLIPAVFAVLYVKFRRSPLAGLSREVGLSGTTSLVPNVSLDPINDEWLEDARSRLISKPTSAEDSFGGPMCLGLAVAGLLGAIFFAFAEFQGDKTILRNVLLAGAGWAALFSSLAFWFYFKADRRFGHVRMGLFLSIGAAFAVQMHFAEHGFWDWRTLISIIGAAFFLVLSWVGYRRLTKFS